MTNSIYILLGANLGSPMQQIKEANNLLVKKIGPLKIASSIYESEAWGIEDQPIFYNQVIELETALNPQECLSTCQEIETQLGRIREIKWGARVIDIDILYYNSNIIDTNNLTIPHPYIQFRNFTLSPLSEIAPNYIHPKLQKTNNQLLIDSQDKLSVIKLENNGI